MRNKILVARLFERMDMSIKYLFLETRPQFLLLSPILVFLGMAMAMYQGSFSWVYFLLSVIGLTLLHTSVNVLNDYSDHKTGIDFKTKRTPFSGGSGFLTIGKVNPEAALKLGLGSFFLAVPIGVYFVIKEGWHLLPLFLVGSVFVLWYTSHLSKVGGGLSEISAGLGLGSLPVLGTFIIINGGFSWVALYASIPSGFLVCNLLLLNEFPDAEADKTGQRRTLPIVLGYKKAALVYSTLIVMAYLWVVIGVALGLMPAWALIALLTLPFGLRAISGALRFKSFEELIPAQGANILTVLLTQLLLGCGYIVANLAS
ncbi:MAG: prenyltransferase [candidate division Zixibacteria bacterium CG_4_9_14_3_um_filter_46_8]|nr:MAG: prenyltransferase [candidate division Zixibacteria bacterium CG_4_9_14_3_um_filter_46_8]